MDSPSSGHFSIKDIKFINKLLASPYILLSKCDSPQHEHLCIPTNRQLSCLDQLL